MVHDTVRSGIRTESQTQPKLELPFFLFSFSFIFFYFHSFSFIFFHFLSFSFIFFHVLFIFFHFLSFSFIFFHFLSFSFFFSSLFFLFLSFSFFFFLFLSLFFLFLFFFHFSCFFLLRFFSVFGRFLAFGQVEGNARHYERDGRVATPTNQSFRVCKVNLATLKVAIIRDQIEERSVVVLVLNKESGIWKDSRLKALLRHDQLKYIDVEGMRVVTNNRCVTERIRSY